MRNLFAIFFSALCLVASVVGSSASTKSEEATPWETVFWAPSEPPRAHYTIDCRIDSANGTLEGTETIRLKNNSNRALNRLAMSWLPGDGNMLEIKVNGEGVSVVGRAKQDGSPFEDVVFDLPAPLQPGETGLFFVTFGWKMPNAGNEIVTSTGWHPRLYWTVATHDDFDVRVDIPLEYTLITSGRQDSKTGRYRAEHVRSFGLVFGKGLHIKKALAGKVLVQCLYTDKGAECAELLLTTAVDVVNFYRERFGLYPYKVLTIIPGADQPMGGCPVDTNIVMIHGQERMQETGKVHWQRITAHEIGHQYWSEYVLERDTPTWFEYLPLGSLMVGLGIYADREYCHARGINSDYGYYFGKYADALQKGRDTTIAMSAEKLLEVDYDLYNQVIVHAKGYAVVSALESVLGKAVFDRIYRRCLKEFAGRNMGMYDFQVVCEEESRQDLSWFFDQWVHTNWFPAYDIASKESSLQGDHYLTKVEVKSVGTLKIPVAVAADFEDGTRQVKYTDRLLETNILEFESGSPLRDVRLDPDGELALISQPLLSKMAFIKKIDEMPWTGAGSQAKELLADAEKIDLQDPSRWLKLGMTLYDGCYYEEALGVFQRLGKTPDSSPLYIFSSYVWQGHILDILGSRDEALHCYQEALKVDIGETYMRHDQYKIRVDRQWVEERLETPFQRK